MNEEKSINLNHKVENFTPELQYCQPLVKRKKFLVGGRTP